MTVHEDVFTTVAATIEAADDQAIVDELVSRGYDPLRAELLAVFVPLGLARAVIARLPVDSRINWSDNVIVGDPSGTHELVLKLEAVPEFQIARHIGEETFENGVIPRDLFSMAVSFSIELKLVNQALDAGVDISGLRIAAPRLLRLVNAPGFEDWYRKTRAVS